MTQAVILCTVEPAQNGVTRAPSVDVARETFAGLDAASNTPNDTAIRPS